MRSLAQFEPMRAIAKPTERQLPNYKLYAESVGAEAVDWLHCESIAARSKLHNWEILPHRHEAMVQLIHMGRGRAHVQLDTLALQLAGPAIVVVPALVAHGFRFSPQAVGTVITVNEAHLAAMLAAEPQLSAALSEPVAQPLRSGEQAVQALANAAQSLYDEFIAASRWRRLALDGALARLVVAAGRTLEPRQQGNAIGSRALGHIERYKALVDREFRKQPSVTEMAAAIGITSTQLTRICQQVLGHSALAVLHARLTLQAKRELRYTTLSVKQIAHELGFADAAYFTRFFQREVRTSPTEWRSQASQR